MRDTVNMGLCEEDCGFFLCDDYLYGGSFGFGEVLSLLPNVFMDFKKFFSSAGELRTSCSPYVGTLVVI